MLVAAALLAVFAVGLAIGFCLGFRAATHLAAEVIDDALDAHTLVAPGKAHHRENA